MWFKLGDDALLVYPYMLWMPGSPLDAETLLEMPLALQKSFVRNFNSHIVINDI